jgi:hypothetical protein
LCHKNSFGQTLTDLNGPANFPAAAAAKASFGHGILELKMTGYTFHLLILHSF